MCGLAGHSAILCSVGMHTDDLTVLLTIGRKK